jgi:Glutathione-dependent formaldehyde-activating enzyme
MPSPTRGPRVRIPPPPAESGANSAQVQRLSISAATSSGCQNCGTPIYACAVDNPQVYALRVGTITQRAAFEPQRQGWRRSALGWVDGLAGVPATEKSWELTNQTLVRVASGIGVHFALVSGQRRREPLPGEDRR